MRGNAGRIWSAVAIAACSAVIVTLAVLYPGYSSADVKLNDGGVWVTRAADFLIGHLNYPSRVLDGGTRSQSAGFDLFQDGNDVVAYDAVTGAVSQLDPATVAWAGNGGTLTAGSRVAMRHGQVGVIDAASDGLYVLKTSTISGFSAVGRDPIVTMGKGSVVTTSASGTVFAASLEKGELVSVAGDGATPEKRSLGTFQPRASLAITAVGELPVVLDGVNGVLYTSGRTIQVPEAKGGVLQAPGPVNDKVLIAGAGGLIQQPLDGGAATVVPVLAGGAPAQPVWLNGCAYAVWSGTAAYVRDCEGTAKDVNAAIPDAGAQPRLTLRQNRNVVVVNELGQGLTWLIADNLEKVDNWQDVMPREADGEQQSDRVKNQFTLPKRTVKNNPPTAVNDEFGIRAGATTVLPVLENDSDPDGDLLTAALAGEPPAGVQVQPARSGAALQVVAGANAQGKLTFRYRADDGRKGTDDATVTLLVRPRGEQTPPRQKRVQTVQLETRASASYDALVGWSDAEGDELYLEKAWSDIGDLVSYRSNGMIRFTDATGERGIHEVKLLVSDGTDSFQGVLRVDVRPKGSLAPIANADRYSMLAGSTITVAPLANDLSTSGKELRLAKLDQVAGLKTAPDFTAGTFAATTSVPGTYYVQYLVTDGPNAADGIVRIDVKAPAVEGLEPIATRDTALLPTAREALVDVLANDTDPKGGILVVQSVTVPAGSRVSAEVLEHRLVRVRDLGGLNGPTTVSYRVSNGSKWTDGEIRVVPVSPPQNQAPVTATDRATVRAGDVVTVDVLSNDYHPGGDALKLLPSLRELPTAGAAWVSEGKVRYRAGQTEGSESLVYEVTDSQHHVASAYVRIQIIGPDPENNGAPLPRSVTARTVAGTEVRIPIPLDGIDPDGDSVELLGISSAPKKGRVELGDSWLVYHSYPGAAGTDSFDYSVRDRLGSSATASVVVGIAAPSNQNRAPYTVRDEVTVRPGRSVSVPVLQNDSDPDGDNIGLVTKGLTVPNGVQAEVAESRIVVRTPTAEGSYAISYTAVDEFGAKAQGSLIVAVSADAPLRAPIARDDRVATAEIGAKPTVTLAVLDNDEDPDGVVEDLTVSTDDPNAVARTDGALDVTLSKQPQLILYKITDADQQSDSAVVFVPGTDTIVPTLKAGEPVEVVAGKELRLPLADHVAVRPGHTPRVAVADTVRASHANGGSLVADEKTLAYTSDPAFFGPDAISVEVTDGEGPDDPKGNTAYVSIPILVIPAHNQPPVFLDTTVQVAPGEDPADLNWRKLSSDPDAGDLAKLALRVTSAPSGIRADVNGDHLMVSADSSTPQGTQADIEVELGDGTSAATKGKVGVLVTTSQRPLPVAVDDVIGRADQGKPVSVDVLANDTNPFPDKPLTVVAAKVIKGRGTATIEGSKVVVTPDASFVGTMQVAYRIQDDTRAPEREAEATISVTVQGVPDQPSRPVVLTVGDRTVVLQWAPPENNGRPITGYTVSSAARHFTQKCGSTTCTLKGLTNDVEYTFTVVATNEIGDSKPSPASAIARPDTRPDTPAPPKLTFGDGSLTVSWVTPHSSGSPVSSYNLEISPAPNSGPVQLTNVTGNRFVWDGLANGTAYQVRVQAVNRAPDPSDWSQYSKPEVPAGKPAAPGRPTTDPATAVGSQAQLNVTWPALTQNEWNGDATDEYTLKVMHGGSSRTITVHGTSQNITVDPSTTDYTFSVTATNKAGESGSSPTSAPRRAAVAPAAPVNLTATPGDGRAKLTFSSGDLNGSTAGEITYHYKVNQTGAQGTISSGSWVSGLNNGTKYTFDVWATSSVAGVKPGAAATSNAVTPYGKPIITLDGIDRLDNAVRFRWHVDSNGSPLTSQNPALSGTSGTKTVTGLAPGQSTSITVSYANAAGTSSATWSGQANDPPPPMVTLSKGATVTGTGANGCSVGSTCYKLHIVAANFSPGSTYKAACYVDGTSYWTQNVTTNGSGGWSADLQCYSGFAGTQASLGGVMSNTMDFR